MKKIILLSLVFVLVGCNAVPKSFEQGLALIDKAAKLAEKQGTAYSATIRWNGEVEGLWVQGINLDSGVTVEVSFHGNAASERAAVGENND